MSRAAHITLNVDPSTIHVDTDADGAPVIAVDTSTLLISIPLTVEGLGVIADAFLQWQADNDHAFSIEVDPVGHIDDTPQPRRLPLSVVEAASRILNNGPGPWPVPPEGDVA